MISREGGEIRGVVGWFWSRVQGFCFRLPRQGPEFDGEDRFFDGLGCFDAGGVVLVHPALVGARWEQFKLPYAVRDRRAPHGQLAN